MKYFSEHNIPLPSTCKYLLRLYLIPRIHKNPYKTRYIAGSRTCTTKPLSSLLTKAFQVIKEQQVKYCNSIYRTTTTECGYLRTLHHCFPHQKNIMSKKYPTSVLFSTLYTTIPHEKLKDRICRLIKFSFKKFNYINISNNRIFLSENIYDKPNYVSWNCK